MRSEFTVDDVAFLAETGRVSKVVAKIANLLRIKVLLKGNNDSTIVATAKIPERKLSAVKVKVLEQKLKRETRFSKKRVFINFKD